MTNTNKTRIYVNQKENDTFFGQKLPTWRDGFCWIERKTYPAASGMKGYEADELALVKVGGRMLAVSGEDIIGWAE